MGRIQAVKTFKIYQAGQIRGLMKMALVVAAIPLPTGLAEQPGFQSPASATAEVLFSDTCDGGMIFINGEYVEAPYKITATRDTVFVNQIPMDALPRFAGRDDHGEDGLESRGRRGPVEGLRRGEPRWNQASRQQRSGENATHRQSAIQQAENLWQLLTDESSLVLVFSETPLIPINRGDVTYCLCSNFLNEESSDEYKERILRTISNNEARSKVQAWLNNYQPPAPVLARMQIEVDKMDAVVTEDRRKSDALVRMDTMAYPLTLIAMMLGVIALGHILKWTAHNIVSNQNGEISRESIRGVEVALLLMAGMSAVDLAWTILASQAGTMREVNPMAAGLIDSPMALAVFKVVATSLGFGLLYALRTQKRGQEVTWWMCLVCVLVTFRWVLFDSMA